METVPLIKYFFESLNSHEIEYCHWKSNHLIKSFLQGKGDLDILISKSSQNKFKEILSEFKFKLVVSPTWESTTDVFHYYGLDEKTGKIVHLHIYFELFTGGNLIKNYHLPLAGLLLESSNKFDGVRIPDRPSELLVFVIRKILECGSLPDFLFALREEKIIKKEFNWLFNHASYDKAKALLPRFIPELDAALFDDCILALQSKPKFYHRASLSKKIQRKLSSYSVNTSTKNKWLTWKKFFYVLFHKFISKKNVYGFSSGGVFITFVGADASGKSTHAKNTSRWLGKFANTQRIHSGLPPATWLTFIPRFFLPVFRKLIPNQRTNFIELKHHSYNPKEYKDARYSILFLVRSIMIAFDQRNLINKARRKAEKGAIIISDRYPSATLGGMDGPRVDPSFFDSGNPLKRFLAIIIKNIYSNISKPDIVFKLSVPFEVNLQRLLDRGEEIDSKTEEQMRSRRAVMDKWELPAVPVHKIDNSTPFEDVQKKIRHIIWDTI
jgi:thymidylate kinase